MNKDKAVLLLLALVMPVFIFLFLKFFGKNEFVVEPLFTEELPAGWPENCTGDYVLPYQIPEAILIQMSWSYSDSLTLYHFGAHDHQLSRVMETYHTPLVRTIRVFAEINDHPDVLAEGVFLPEESIRHWKRCYFFLSEPNDLLLVDSKRRIRGQYQLDNREDTDRLLVELSVILRHY